MWYTAFKYVFKANDANYVDALMRLYPEMGIESCTVNGAKIACENKTLDDLNSLISEVKQEDLEKELEFTIISERVPASLTTRNVFPKFQPQTEYVNNSKNDREKLEADIVTITNYMLKTDCMMRDPRDGLLFGIRNKEDAWKLLNLLHETLPFASATDLPSIGGILVKSISRTYLLTYNQRENGVTEYETPSFDLDDGFTPSRMGSVISTEMTDAFKQWVQNGRKGFLLPDSNNFMLLKDSAVNTLANGATQRIELGDGAACAADSVVAKLKTEGTGQSADSVTVHTQGSSASPDGLFGFQQREQKQARKQQAQRTLKKGESTQETSKRSCALM